MTRDLRAFVDAVRLPSPWDFGNEVLYALCRKHPLHTEPPVVIAKLWLIGRSYAAAIERRPNKEIENDDFYIDTVAPKVCASKIDQWIASAMTFSQPSLQSFDTLVLAHEQTTRLFNEISGLEKRSLASKYLHFHAPRLFFIYDARAVEGLRKLSSVVGRATKSAGKGDNEYRKFSEKCLRLRDHVKERYRVSLSPRQIDRLLLDIQAK